MVKIQRSKCICGKCGTELWMEWDFEITQVIDKDDQMGESVTYEGEGIAVCPECGNEISAAFRAEEYPVGALNDVKIQRVEDSEETGQSRVEIPDIRFYDM